MARSCSQAAASKTGGVLLGREEAERKHPAGSVRKARMALRTVWVPHRRWAAITDGRSPWALARRIWQRRNVKASRERRLFLTVAVVCSTEGQYTVGVSWC